MFSALIGGALAAVAAPAAAASPADELHVAVHAPLGKGCISGEKLKVAVQKRIGGEKARKTVDVRIQTNDPEPGWMAEVSVAGKSGTRTVRTQSTSCSQLDDGLVLVVTMLVDPEDEKPPAAPPPKGGSKGGGQPSSPPSGDGPGGGWTDDEPGAGDEPSDDDSDPAKKKGPRSDEPKSPPGQAEPPQQPPEALEPGAGEPEPGEPSGDEPSQDDLPGKKPGGKKPDKPAGQEPSGEEPAQGGQKDPKEEQPKKLQFGVGASFVYTTGLSPGGLAGVRGSFAWLSPTPVPIEVAFQYNEGFGQSSWSEDGGWYRQTQTFSLEGLACPALVGKSFLRFTGCAGWATTYFEENLQIDGYSQNGEYSPYSRYVQAFVVSPVAEVRLDFQILSWLRARVGFGAMVPLNAPDLTVYDDLGSPEPASENFIDPVIFRGQLGIEVVLPP